MDVDGNPCGPVSTDEEVDLEGEIPRAAHELEGSWKGSLEERNRKVCENLQLVPPIVRKFRESGANWDDLLQVGYLGLIKAVNSFDEAYQVKFSTYATHFIAGEIRHHLRDRIDTVKKPRWLSALNRSLAVFLDAFLQKEHRLPTLVEIGKGLNVSEEGVVELFKARNITAPAALDDMNEETIAVDKIRSLHYETFRLPIEDRIVLDQTLEGLRALEQKVVYLFFYHDLTQTEIAREMGLSQKKVSRTLQRALGQMREVLNRDLW